MVHYFSVMLLNLLFSKVFWALFPGVNLGGLHV